MFCGLPVKGSRYLEIKLSGYVTRIALDTRRRHDLITGYEFINLGKMMITGRRATMPTWHWWRWWFLRLFRNVAKAIDPRHE